MKKILAILLIATLMLGMLVSCKKDDGKDDGADNNGENNGVDNNGENNGTELPAVDFFSGDLSEFVELDEKYYKGFTVVVDPDRVSSFDVENKIIGVLYKYKSAESVEGDGIISVGDTVNIFYKGYYMSGENNVYFSGGSNVGGKSYALGIGSASFIPGFEYNMIGKNPADYDENNPMIIESYFPEGYKSAELAGKTAFFEVYVEKDADGKYLQLPEEHAFPVIYSRMQAFRLMLFYQHRLHQLPKLLMAWFQASYCSRFQLKSLL